MCSMRPHRFCQSCGVRFCDEDACKVMQEPEDEFCFLPGTETDGVLSNTYCRACYSAGAFVHPDWTVREMQAACIKWLVKRGIRECKAEFMVETLPTLDRWNGAL